MNDHNLKHNKPPSLSQAEEKVIRAIRTIWLVQVVVNESPFLLNK